MLVRQIQFYIFELDRLTFALNKAKELGERALIHLELETGMNRTGLRKEEVKEAVKMLKTSDVVLLLFNSFLFYGLGFAILENHDKGEYLRIRGITENHLEEWKKQMKDSLSSKSSYKQKITQSADKRRIKELESESVKQRPLLAATHLRTTHAAFAACSSSLYKA